MSPLRAFRSAWLGLRRGKSPARRPGLVRARAGLALEELEGRLVPNVGNLDLTFGDPDPNFGRPSGKALLALGGTPARAAAVAVLRAGNAQADDKVLVAGSAGDGPDERLLLARLNPDGKPDQDFGRHGFVLTDFGHGPAAATALVLQNDGVLVAGHLFNGTDHDFLLARFKSDGTLDTAFGDPSSPGSAARRGWTATDFGGDDLATALTLDARGRIVVAGSTRQGDRQQFALARYLPDGRLDTSFGPAHTGLVTTTFGPGPDGAGPVVVQPDGHIVAGGSADLAHDKGRHTDFALARYTADGAPDTTFGAGGKVTTDFGPGDAAVSGLAAQGDAIIAVGRANDGRFSYAALARYAGDGTLDPTFGQEASRPVFGPPGTVITPVGPTRDAALAVTIQPNGRIAVAGGSAVNTDPDVGSGAAGNFLLLRYGADGRPDPTFGINGQVTTAVGNGAMAEATALAFTDNGKLVAVGTALDTNVSRVGVARYQADIRPIAVDHPVPTRCRPRRSRWTSCTTTSTPTATRSGRCN